MEWDGLFEIDFDNALKALANVESAAIIYSLEDDFRQSDIEQLRQQADALEKSYES